MILTRWPANDGDTVSIEGLERDEPVFVLRASDLLALSAIRHYLGLAEELDLYGHARQVEYAVLEFVAWAEVDPDNDQRRRIPFHEHQSADDQTQART